MLVNDDESQLDERSITSYFPPQYQPPFQQDPRTTQKVGFVKLNESRGQRKKKQQHFQSTPALQDDDNQMEQQNSPSPNTKSMGNFKRRKINFDDIKLKSIKINSDLTKSKNVKKKKRGFFNKLTGLFKKKKKVVVESDSEESDPPKYIYQNEFATNTEVYEKDFNQKDIKNIFSRLINNGDPQFVDVIICTAVEKIAKKRDAYPCLAGRKMVQQVQAGISSVCFSIISHPLFEFFSLMVIVVNSFTLALNDPIRDTIPYAQKTDLEKILFTADSLFLYIYTVEMILKIIGMGFIFGKKAYLSVGWNVLDFIIVMSALYGEFASGGGTSLTTLRTLRILRPLKTISKSQDLRVILNAIGSSIPMLMNIVFVLTFFILVMAIMGTQLFQGILTQRCFNIADGKTVSDKLCGSNPSECSNIGIELGISGLVVCGKMLTNPNWDVTSFDSFLNSCLMVWQCITMEGWTSIMYFIEACMGPFTNIYFFMIIFIGAFFLINLTLAVITIFFIKAQNEAREQIEEKKQKSQAELEQSYKISSFQLLTYKRMLMKQDVSITQMFSKAYKTMKISLFTQGFHTEHTKGRKNEIPKGYLVHRIGNKKIDRTNFSIKQKTLTEMELDKIDKQMESEFSNVNDTSDSQILSDSTDSSTGQNEEDAEDDQLNHEMGKLTQSRRFDSTLKSVHSFTSMKSFNLGHGTKQGKTSNWKFILPRQKMSALTTLTISNKTGKGVQFMGMHNGPRSFKKNLPNIQEDDADLKEKVESSSEGELLKSNSSDFESKRQENMTIEQQKSSEKKKTANLDFIFQEEFHPKTAKTVESQLENDMQSQGSFFLSESEMDEAISLHSSNKVHAAKKRKKKTVRIKGSSLKPEKEEVMHISSDRNKGLQAMQDEMMIEGMIDDDSNVLQTFTTISPLPDVVFTTQRGESQKESIDANGQKIVKKKNDGNNRKVKFKGGSSVEKISKEEQQWEPPYNFPKSLLKPKYKYDEELLKIKDIPYQYFKFRVRHFEQYIANSYNDVLVNRQKEEEDYARVEEEKVFRTQRLKIHYWKRLDPEQHMDEEQLLEQEELLRQENNKSINKSKEVNSYGSVLELLTEKSIELEYKKQPELPIVQHEAAYHIQDYIEQKLLKWEKTNDDSEKHNKQGQRAKQMQNQARQVKKEREQLKWAQFEYDNVQKELQTQMFPGEYTKDMEFDNDKFNNNCTLEMEYLKQRRTDQKAGQIQDFNFSGDQVKPKLQHKYYTCQKIFDSVEKIDSLIWIPGYYGITLAFKKRIQQFVFSNFFDQFIIIMVIFNTGVLAMQNLDTNNPSMQALRKQLNLIFTWIFIIELVLKLFSMGIHNYVSDGMNLFDALIVLTSVVEMLFLTDDTGETQGGATMSVFRTAKIFRVLKTLKTLRILRTIKLLRALDYLQVIIEVVQRTYQQFLYIIFLLMLFILIYALIGLQIYQGKFIVLEDNNIRHNYSDFFQAFLTVFQIMTMENWQDILYVSFRSSVHPLISSCYLISWIFFGNFVLLNLFLAILIDGFTQKPEKDQDDIFFGEEDKEIMGIRLKKKYERIEKKQREEDLMLLKQHSQEIFKSLPSDSQLGQQSSLGTNNFSTIKTINSEGSNKDMQAMSMKQFGTQKSIDDGEPASNKDRTFITCDLRCDKSFFLFSQNNWLRKTCFWICYKHHQEFEYVIIVIIILGSIKLAGATFIDVKKINEPGIDQQMFYYSELLDLIFNIIFQIEFLIKAITMGLVIDKNSYLSDGWNKLDFIIVVSSVNEMILNGGDVAVLKILRMLRILRPLRFISHNKNLKIIVNSLIGSMTGIMNVGIVILLIFMMYSILGVYIIGTKMHYCYAGPFNTDFDYLDINKTQCEQDYGYTWASRDFNFNNFYEGLNSLFVLSSLEAWPTIMEHILDGQDDPLGPSKNANLGQGAAYVIVFLLIGSFFFMNLFVGVIFDEFEHQSQLEKGTEKDLTDEQLDWFEMFTLILKAKPNFNLAKPPKEAWKLKIYHFIKHWAFDPVILFLIMVNVLTMSMNYYQADPEYINNLLTINAFLTWVFIGECALKLVSYGPRAYFHDQWNQFDFFVVMSSIVDMAMGALGQEMMQFLAVGPQIARVLRILRVSRLLRLVKSLQNLQKIIQTMIYSIPKLMNVVGLVFLFFFILAALSWFLFQDVTFGTQIDQDIVNFKDFRRAITTLFRCSTGEDWQAIMVDLWHQPQDVKGCVPGITCAKYSKGFTVLFFLMLVIIMTFIMLNLFMLVLVQQFELNFSNPDNPLDKFNENTDIFRQIWIKFSTKYEGVKISSIDLPKFFMELSEPMGFKGLIKSDLNWELQVNADLPVDIVDASKELFQMEVSEDSDGFTYFNDVLFVALKRTFGFKLMGQLDGPDDVELFKVPPKSLQILKLREIKIREQLRIKRFMIKQKQKGGKLKVKKFKQQLEKNKYSGNKQSNPFLKMCIAQMTLKAWVSYTKDLKIRHQSAKDIKQEFFEYVGTDSSQEFDETQHQEFEHDMLEIQMDDEQESKRNQKDRNDFMGFNHDINNKNSSDDEDENSSILDERLEEDDDSEDDNDDDFQGSMSYPKRTIKIPVQNPNKRKENNLSNSQKPKKKVQYSNQIKVSTHHEQDEESHSSNINLNINNNFYVSNTIIINQSEESSNNAKKKMFKKNKQQVKGRAMLEDEEEEEMDSDSSDSIDSILSDINKKKKNSKRKRKDQ